MINRQKDMADKKNILQRDAFLFWITCLFLCIQIQATPLNMPLEILLTFIILIGISHGATDFLILKKYSNPIFIPCFKYIGIAIMAILFWIACPLIGLACFLIISAYHFGCDWEKGELAILQSGMGLICIPLYYHPNATLEILNLISDKHANLSFLVTGSSPIFYLSVLMTLYRLLHKKWLHLEYLSLLVLGKYLHPLTFFTLYFCTLHSVRHINHYARHHPLAKKDIFALIATSFTSWCLLILFSSLITQDLKNVDLHDYLRPLFIFIFSITIPHMLLAIETKRRHRQQTD